MSIGPLFLGIAILVSGEHRFQSPIYEAPSMIAPWWAWGVVSTLLGVWMVGSAFLKRSNFWCCFSAGCFFCIWASFLWISSLYVSARDPQPPSFASPTVYTVVGIWLIAVAAWDNYRPRPIIRLKQRKKGPRCRTDQVHGIVGSYDFGTGQLAIHSYREEPATPPSSSSQPPSRVSFNLRHQR